MLKMTHSLPNSMPRLEGRLVALRAFEAADQDLVLSVVSDSLITLITSVPAGGGPDEVAEYIARQQNRLTEGAGCSFVITDAASESAVGQITLWLGEADKGRATIGYWVAPQYRRRGFAHDALSTLTTWAESHIGVHRLQLFIEPWNSASWRLAEACGYDREGLLRGWELVGSQYKDMYIYSRISSG